MKQDPLTSPDADALFAQHIAELKRLTLVEARALPEASSRGVQIGAHDLAFTVFSEARGRSTQMVTLQLARRSWSGLATYHREVGLVFGSGVAVREASESELQQPPTFE